MRAIAIVMLLAACASRSDEEVTRARCERYRDHLVELRIKDAPPGVDVKTHRIAMKGALGEEFLASCERLSHPQLECGFRARDMAAASACLQD